MNVDDRKSVFGKEFAYGLVIIFVTFILLTISLIVALTAFDAPPVPTGIAMGSIAFVIAFGLNVWIAFRSRGGK
jgi:hypothetical protein